MYSYRSVYTFQRVLLPPLSATVIVVLTELSEMTVHMC